MSRAARARGLRTLAHYDNRAVLLEWKIGLGQDSVVLEKRVNQVAAFLHKLEPSFHSLPCRGYVKDHDANRYGYIRSSGNLSINFPSSTLTFSLAELGVTASTI